MATIHIQRVRTGFLRIAGRLPQRTQERTTRAAASLREHLHDGLNSGSLPLRSDTTALAASLSVQTPQGSEGAARLADAMAKYLVGGRYTEAVRKELTPTAYTQAHFEARTGQEEPLPATQAAIAGVFTLLAWGAWFEMGHQNEFTGGYEHRPWMFPAVHDWAASGGFEGAYKGLLQGL